MVSAYNSALSALKAYGVRIQSNANNIANANTDNYKRTAVTLASEDPAGVRAQVEQTTTAGPQVFREGQEGPESVTLSNVDLGSELPEMNLNSQMYTANLKTIQTVDTMLDSLLDLKA
jgi:flagellar hook protein FlgE